MRKELCKFPILFGYCSSTIFSLVSNMVLTYEMCFVCNFALGFTLSPPPPTKWDIFIYIFNIGRVFFFRIVLAKKHWILVEQFVVSPPGIEPNTFSSFFLQGRSLGGKHISDVIIFTYGCWKRPRLLLSWIDQDFPPSSRTLNKVVVV